MLKPILKKNDRRAWWLIGIFSFIVFATVSMLGFIELPREWLPFEAGVLPALNSTINSIVSVCLVAAVWAVRNKKYVWHKNLVLLSMVLSCLFLISYITHKLFIGDVPYGGKYGFIYYPLLISHILLAAVILPFILVTAYRGATADYALHKKIARYTFPLWLYVSITGPLVYMFIKPYYP